MNDAEFAGLMDRLGADQWPLTEERALFRAGFQSAGYYCGEELWEDPEDRADEGGMWVGRCEAMRRVRVRVLQARHGFGPLLDRGQNPDPFGAG